MVFMHDATVSVLLVLVAFRPNEASCDTLLDRDGVSCKIPWLPNHEEEEGFGCAPPRLVLSNYLQRKKQELIWV